MAALGLNIDRKNPAWQHRTGFETDVAALPAMWGSNSGQKLHLRCNESQLTRSQEISQIVRALVSEINKEEFPNIAPEQAVVPNKADSPFSVSDLQSTIGIPTTAPSRTKLPAPAALNSSLNASTEPKLSTVPFPARGYRFGQGPSSARTAWFQCCEALLKIPFCNTARRCRL